MSPEKCAMKERGAVAFNLGCDARLAGEARTANQFAEDDLQQQWRSGWDHVNKYWGADAKWPVTKLPRAAR